MTDKVTEPGVRDPGTLGDGEIPDRESIETETDTSHQTDLRDGPSLASSQSP